MHRQQFFFRKVIQQAGLTNCTHLQNVSITQNHLHQNFVKANRINFEREEKCYDKSEVY